MPHSYDSIMETHNTDLFQEISRLLLVIMYAIVSKAVTGYHYIKDKYMEYKYTTTDIRPTTRYFLNSDNDHGDPSAYDNVPLGWIYIEEWTDIKGHKKNIVLYEGDLVPMVWSMTPFERAPAKCPWVWVGDKETEVDLTRTFDKFLVPGNVIKPELVSRLTDYTTLIYIETKTFNQVKFPGDGLTIEEDV